MLLSYSDKKEHLFFVVPQDKDSSAERGYKEFVRQSKDIIDQPAPKKNYGKYAQVLDKHRFWQHEKVYKLAGTDKQYQYWCIKQMNCAITGRAVSWVSVIGEYRAEYAHVNTSDNSGIGLKAEYSGLPMDWETHRLVEHQKGLYALHSLLIKWAPIEQREILNKVDMKDWLKKEVKVYLAKWAREVIKIKYFGCDSWKDVEPEKFIDWASKHKVLDIVPQDYRDCILR